MVMIVMNQMNHCAIKIQVLNPPPQKKMFEITGLN